MSRVARWLALAGIAFFIPCLALAGNANFVLGSRSFDEDDWAPVEDQNVFGVNVDFGVGEWPVNLVAGFHASSDDETVASVDFELSTTELSFGVVKIWDQYTHARPFLGGGLSFINADAEVGFFGLTAGEDDSSAGLYINGGIFWRLGERFNIGIDGRFLTGTDLTFAGFDTDVDYTQFGLILGWGW